MKGKDYFMNWVVWVYAAYLFFNKGVAYSFMAEFTLGVGVLLAIRERTSLTVSWNRVTQILAVLLLLNGVWIIRGFFSYPFLEVIRDSFIFNYALLLFIPFLFTDQMDFFKQRIFQLYAWLPLIATAGFFATAFFPALETWSLFGKIPLFEYKKGDLGVQLLIALMLLLSGQLKTTIRMQILNYLLIAYLFFILGTFNRGGMVAFMTGLGLYLFLIRKEELFKQWKDYGRLIPVLLILSLGIYSLTKVEDKVQGRNTGIEQLQKNFSSIFGGNPEGSLSDNIVWRLGWWNKIVDYTFAGPYFLQGKGLGINLTVDDEIPVDANTDRAPLRSPHSFHMSILARYGVPVFGIWIFLLISLFRGILIWLPRKEAAFFLAFLLAALVNASFDVSLEGPMSAIPFWMLMGMALASAKPLQPLVKNH